ncbi:apolipoprotein N-acyltransferase [Novosphingobium umbonatum]|uniref:Apolipoprotein N-acyltransferase n=1 Tax=Novosphingobium umbonatum TaxID=1908524 RepID=A0A437N0H4_9SPHN|nr:apolipoprotein N-acyltransferase [Novosphingobium umbonatum]RVU03426.1 apolipoprotein N-acyltransferase [Novosphingobium umbonatum]
MALIENTKRRARHVALFVKTWRWHAAALVVCGALAALGFAPLGWWWASLLGVGALVGIVVRAPSWRLGLAAGWLWGVGHFVAGNAWIATAFTYQAKMPAWLGGVGVFLLALYLAIYPALAALGLWFLRGRGPSRILGFAGAWTLAEMARGFVFTGFPWNPLGVALLGDDGHAGLAALAPWLGTYGLSGLMAGLAAAAQEGVALWPQRRGQGAALVLAPCALIAGGMAWPAPAEVPSAIPYTLIQPNIAQQDLDDPAHYNAQYQASAQLSRPMASASYRLGQPRLVLWPESGVPDYVRDGYPWWYYQDTFAGDPSMARWRLARAIGDGGLLLSGTVELDFQGTNAVGGRNVIMALDSKGRVLDSYAKAHLVPFGEYLPGRSFLKPLGLERVIPGDFDFRAGKGPRTVDLGPLGKAGMQICYEIVFSGEVTDRSLRADYIVNPSNDGWFGAWGPPQHLAQARLRAIEEGLPVLRSTTNGVSAVVDAHGIVRQAAPRDTAARFDGLVPAALPPTLFARAGNILPLGVAVFLLALAALALRRREGY